MKILVVGSSGREHALIWKISKSALIEKIYCAPGNTGTAEIAESVSINTNEIEKLALFAEENKIDITIVCHEVSLSKGIVDFFTQKGLKIFGPNKNAALLKSEKIFTNEIDGKHLGGEQVSFIALTDGTTVLPLSHASMDYIHDKSCTCNGNKTSIRAIGACSPAPALDFMMRTQIMDEVMLPAVQYMAAQGSPIKGMICARLIINKDQIKVIEFNTSPGEPEIEAVLVRLKTDIIPLIKACIDGNLNRFSIETDHRYTACIVISERNDPSPLKKNTIIKGLDGTINDEDVIIFHANTIHDHGSVTTNGRGALSVTAMGDTMQKAIDNAYRVCSRISWEKSSYDKNIGAKAIARLGLKPKAGVIMGSDSDFPVMKETLKILRKFDIPYEVTIASAHRTPDIAVNFSSSAKDKGIGVIIAGAGHAAHLAGVLAAHTTLPVIGIPIDSSALLGIDSLLSTVQMPPGIPVATMAVGKPGAINAGVFAAQILAVSDSVLCDRLVQYKNDMAKKVNKKAENIM